MSDATLGQANQIVNLIAQKKPTNKLVQTIIESSLLSDLFSADVDVIKNLNRFELRKLLRLDPVYTIFNVDYGKNLDELLKMGKYTEILNYDDLKNREAKVHSLVDDNKLREVVPIYLISFPEVDNGYITTDKVIFDLSKWGLRPATHHELLILGAQFPDLQRDFSILALGTTWMYELNNQIRKTSLYLSCKPRQGFSYESDEKRELRTSNRWVVFSGGGGCRESMFAAVEVEK